MQRIQELQAVITQLKNENAHLKSMKGSPQENAQAEAVLRQKIESEIASQLIDKLTLEQIKAQ